MTPKLVLAVLAILAILTVVSVVPDGAEGTEIASFGPASVFNDAGTSDLVSIPLDASHVLFAYVDEDGSSNYGTAVIGTISGNSITYGSEYVFNADGTGAIKASKIDNSTVLIVYQDVWTGTAIIATVNGTEITFGPASVFNSGNTYQPSSAIFNSTTALVLFHDAANGGYGTAVVGNITGDSITFGPEYVFNAAYTYEPAASIIPNSTSALVVYRDLDAGNGTAVIATVNGTEITFGAEYTFNAGRTLYPYPMALNSTRAMISYCDDAIGGYGTAIIATVNGTEITFGAECVFNDAGTEYITSSMRDSTRVLLTYWDIVSYGPGKAIIGTISGDSITFFSEFKYAERGPYSVHALIDANHALVVYRDDGNSGYGTARMMTITEMSGGGGGGGGSPDPDPDPDPEPVVNNTNGGSGGSGGWFDFETPDLSFATVQDASEVMLWGLLVIVAVILLSNFYNKGRKSKKAKKRKGTKRRR